MQAISSSHGGGHVVYHHAKFRWTENLTCRFIQLRKEHGNMFTGRKYSAQAGWEFILQKMRAEFPTIMADVHYRVLKKKWSNLLQQYKELKNPVHGDKNKADDISWPFYTAIDEILGNIVLPQRTRRRASKQDNHDDYNDVEDGGGRVDDEDEDVLNPQEFLSVSVAEPDDEDDGADDDDKDPLSNRLNIHLSEDDNDEEIERKPTVPRLHPLKQEVQHSPVFDIDRSKPTPRTRKRSSESLLSRLPRATELTIRPIPRTSNGPEVPPLEPIRTSSNGTTLGRSSLEILRGVEELSRAARAEGEERPRANKRARRQIQEEAPSAGDDEPAAGSSGLERRFIEFVEYTKRRDEENRSILLRMLAAVEDIKKSIG